MIVRFVCCVYYPSFCVFCLLVVEIQYSLCYLLNILFRVVSPSFVVLAPRVFLSQGWMAKFGLLIKIAPSCLILLRL
jgi:hypothetical protein